MDFSHARDRQMLADTLARYFRERYPFEERRRISESAQGWSEDHWAAFAELGVVGAFFEEKDGGFGGHAFDLAAVFEQVGRGLVVEPFLSTMMAGRVLARAGSHQALLSEVISGACILAFAHGEPESYYDPFAVTTLAERSSEGWVLTGTKSIVEQIEAASRILVSARLPGHAEGQQGLGLFLVDAGAKGVGIRSYRMIDGGRGGELTLAATPARLVSQDGAALLETAIAEGVVALCWEAVGVMDVIKAATLDYLRTRKQFGMPIGKFQALQHRMANVAIEIEQARSAAINAAHHLGSERTARERAISAAKFTTGRVGTLVAEEAIQMHGGIGMTWELSLSHFAKRLIMIDHQLGDEDYHLARFIDLGRGIPRDYRSM
jgi:alkylation response protein AidB-like acyl-CoA dehydrogenase